MFEYSKMASASAMFYDIIGLGLYDGNEHLELAMHHVQFLYPHLKIPSESTRVSSFITSRTLSSTSSAFVT